MNWLTNFVRPKIRALVRKTHVTDKRRDKCGACEQMIFRRDLEVKHYVCQQCDFHMRLDPKARLALLFDDGDYQRIELPESPLDPLKFRDSKRYSERLKAARSKTGENDAIIVAHGKMDGMGVVMAVFNFDFMGGSMGVAVGDAIITAARLAVLQRAPGSGLMGAREAEMTKCMTNRFCAWKVTFAHEIFDLATAMDIDYELVREAVVADARIGASHLDVNEGGYRGYGAKSLGNDTKALLDLSARMQAPLRLLRTADRVNESLLPPSDEPPALRTVPAHYDEEAGDEEPERRVA